jgi:hypothetical protein
MRAGEFDPRAARLDQTGPGPRKAPGEAAYRPAQSRLGLLLHHPSPSNACSRMF